jgi:hypothetical protein
MTNGNDPVLQALFDNARSDVLENGFTDQVMVEVGKSRRKTIAIWIGMCLLALIVLWWLAEPVVGLVNLITGLLPVSLFDLGEGWIAVFLAPLNSVAAVVGLGLLGLYAAFRRLFS